MLSAGQDVAHEAWRGTIMRYSSPPRPFRAIVADDHPIFCEGLAALLSEIKADMVVDRANRNPDDRRKQGIGRFPRRSS